MTDLGLLTEDGGLAVALTLLLFGPLLAGVLSWLRSVARWQAGLLVLLGAAQFVALLLLSRLILEAEAALTFALGGHAAPLGIELYLDGLSLMLLWLTWLVGAAVSLYWWGWRLSQSRQLAQLFVVIWLLLWAGLNALLLSGDLFNMYVTLEICTLAAVALVAVTRGAEALTAAMRYLQFALIGSIFYLLGVALVYAEAGTLTLSLLHDHQGGLTWYVALGCMTLGLLVKGALFPLHGWLPPAHAVAPGPASAVLSALVAKAGVYLLLRIWLGPFGASWTPVLAQGMGALGMAGILYASLQALRQPRLKLIIAYSTVAQLGYLLLLIPLVTAGLLAWYGMLYQALAHGLAKAAMFLAAANVIHAIGNDRLDSLAGMDRVLSGNLFVIALAGISLAGLPPSAGFLAKWWLISAALESGQWWWALGIAVGGLLAAAYVFRLLRFGLLAHDPYAEVPEHRAVDLPLACLWPPFLLVGLAILLGFTGELLAPLLGAGAPAVIGGQP